MPDYSKDSPDKARTRLKSFGALVGAFNQLKFRTELGTKPVTEIRGVSLGSGYCMGVGLDWIRRVLMLLDDIGVTEKCLLEIVQKVSVEHEIADWLRRNADLSSVTSLNEKLFSPRIEDVLAFIPAATLNEIYPAAERMTITSPMFEVLLEDDRLMFPSHAALTHPASRLFRFNPIRLPSIL
jgi:hypothetical protein